MLPYDLDFTPFDILTAEELDQLQANIESVSDGTGMGPGAITTENLVAATLEGNMPATTLTSTIATIMTVDLPVTTNPHKYLVIASFEFANAGGTSGDFQAAITDTSNVIQKENYWSPVSGAFFNTVTLSDVFTSSGSDVRFRASKTGTTRDLTARSSYSIVDLGEA